MSNIRRFPETEEVSSKKKIRKQLMRRVRARIYTILLVLFILFVAVFVYVMYERTKVYSGLDLNSSVEFSPASGAKVLNFGDNILSYSKDGAGAMDAKGNLLWNITYDMQNPLISICRNTVAFADYGGSRIYVQCTDGNKYEVDTDMPVRKISVSDNGVVAAVLEDVGVTWIYLYASSGETISYFRTTMEKSGYPLDISLSPSGEVIAVSYYFLDIDDIRSSVAFYNFGEVGQNQIDNYVSGYNYKDTLVPMVQFTSNDYAFAVSTGRRVVFEGAHKPMSIMDDFFDDDILSVYYDEKHVGIVFRNKKGPEKYRLEVYSEKGTLISEKAFDFDYSDVVFDSDQFVLYGTNNVYIGTYGGVAKFETEYEKELRLILPTSSPTRFIFVSDNSVDTVTLK